MCSHFCKTAAYGHAYAPLRGSVVCYLWPGKHRRHIRRLPVVLRAGLCAAIFTKRVCRTPYGIVRRPLAFHVSQRVYSLQKLIFHKTPSALTQLEATAEAHRLNIDCSKL